MTNEKPIFTLQIDGKPVPKGRPRFNRRSGATYTPETTRKHEGRVRVLARDMMSATGLKTLDSALSVNVELFFPFPSKFRKAEKVAKLNRPATTKPDADNVAKALLDALNGVVYEDDAQITTLTVTKRYSDQPRSVIHVTLDDA